MSESVSQSGSQSVTGVQKRTFADPFLTTPFLQRGGGLWATGVQKGTLRMTWPQALVNVDDVVQSASVRGSAQNCVLHTAPSDEWSEWSEWSEGVSKGVNE